MNTPYRLDEPDPEPVTVVIGALGWTRAVPCADVLIGDLAKLQDVPDTCCRLFARYPGLSLVALCTPSGLVLTGHPARRGRLGDPRVSTEVATAGYFAWAAASGVVPVDARPQSRAQLGRPG